MIYQDIINSLISLYNKDVTTSWWFVEFVAKRRRDVMAAARELSALSEVEALQGMGEGVWLIPEHTCKYYTY